jgi:hypothetical protein
VNTDPEDLTWRIENYFPVHDQVLITNGEETQLPSDARSCLLELRPGDNRITLKVRDSEYVERSVELDLIMDIEAPVIDVLSPAPGITYTNDYLSVVWSISDDLKLDTALWKIDDGEWEEAAYEMNGFIPVGEGAHVLRINATDMGGTTTEVSIPFNIGKDDDLKIITPAEGLETNSKYLDLKWEYSGDFEWTRAQLRLGANSDLIYIDSKEVHGIRIQDYARDTSDGPCEVTVRLLDDHGNHISGSNFIILDTQAPKVLFDEIPGYPNIARSDIHVSWRGYEENTLKGYRIMIDDGDWKDAGLETGVDLDLENGEHTLYVEATDLAGNSRICSLELKIDNAPPVIHLLSPGPGDVIRDGYVDLNWHVTDDGSLERAVILLDGVEIRNATGLSRRSFVIEEAGEHTISIVVWDDSGNEGSVEIPLIADLDPAEIDWISLPGELTNEREWMIEWAMSDDVGIDSVTLLSDDNEMEMDKGLLSSVIEFDDGAHVLELTVVDLGGHTSKLVHEFRIDTMAPSVSINRERTIIIDDRIELYFTIGEDPSGIGSVEIRIDVGAYEPIRSERVYTSGVLDAGNHVITVRVEDEAGNIKEEMYHFDISGAAEKNIVPEEERSAFILPLAIFAAAAVITTSLWYFLRRKRSKGVEGSSLKIDGNQSNIDLLPVPAMIVKDERCLPPADRFVETVQGLNYHRPDSK